MRIVAGLAAAGAMIAGALLITFLLATLLQGREEAHARAAALRPPPDDFVQAILPPPDSASDWPTTKRLTRTPPAK